MRLLPGVSVSEMVSTPLWSCGSSPVVVAAMAGSPLLMLTLLQHGAGHSTVSTSVSTGLTQHARHTQHRSAVNGVHMAILILLRKLEEDWRGGEEGRGDAPPQPDLLTWAGRSPHAQCLRFLLRSVPRVPGHVLRDLPFGSDPARLLPRPCSCDAPALTHLARVAAREFLRARNLLPEGVSALSLPDSLRRRLSLLED
ncbi:uncharacterized protein LOC126982000 [Eriocheir sinensis]|uniref:uncharacterized protein LOC126982000 n=1 Tax=Eriocheir sinensis TaxID=95602 RepID=UPI0021C7647F|nr:uncharacterized protein LOC126982000 [Eriocheir sinensis]